MGLTTPTGDAVLPVLLVHGIRTSRTMWRAQVEALEEAGRRVVAVDLPGHGTRMGEEFTLAAAREVIADGVEELGGRVLLVGLSLGGLLAVDYAARHPDQVAGLVAAACSTSPQVRLRAGWAEVSRWIERTPGSGAQLNAFVVRTFLSPQGALDIGAGGFALTVMSQALREVAELDPESDLAAARYPVWLVNGRFDHFRMQEARMLRAARSSGRPVRHVVVPHARHLVSLDAPVAFARVLFEALDAVDEAPTAATAATDATATAATDATATAGPGLGSGQQVPGPRPADERG